jgi:hypothetical protein
MAHRPDRIAPRQGADPKAQNGLGQNGKGVVQTFVTGGLGQIDPARIQMVPRQSKDLAINGGGRQDP